jgi:uncharacterized protein
VSAGFGQAMCLALRQRLGGCPQAPGAAVCQHGRMDRNRDTPPFVERRAAGAAPAQRPAPALDEETLRWLQGVFQCARDGDITRLAPLMDQGLSPNLRNEHGDSLLMLAVYHGHAPAVRMLLQHGADPDLANDRQQTPLAGAAFKGHVEVTRLLLDHGAHIDAAGPDGRTALFYAAMFDRVEAAALLLSHGADPHRRDAQGLDAAGAACRMGAEGTARLLGKAADSGAP